jgi:histidine triad (HIT) family protein
MAERLQLHVRITGHPQGVPPKSMENCIFCQIIGRRVRAETVYEDDRVLAFVAVNPVSIGHALIVPRTHCENLVDITVESLNHVIGIAKSIAMDLLAKKGTTGINLLHATGKDAQQSVFHFHLHVILDIQEMALISG